VVSLALCFVFVSLEVRHGFDREMNSKAIQLLEWGTYVLAWSMMGFVLIAINHWVKQSMLKQLGQLLGAVSICTAILGPVLIASPLWHEDSVGSMYILNWLLYLYALPAGLGVAWAWLSRDNQPVARLCAVVSLVLCFVFISLEVRHVFHSPILKGGTISNAEMYTYSTAWIIFGGLLLALGIIKQSMALRYASLAVMLLSVAKVFAYDMRHLEDLYRVVSFLGLGISLLLLGFVYQRFVFSGSREAVE
jgi:uncharacterized membrane protein